MKLSLAWIFDHIDARLDSQNVDRIIRTFNQVTAEIEQYESVTHDYDSFAVARIISQKDYCHVFIEEWECDARLCLRDQSRYANNKNVYALVKKVGGSITWATLQDFGLDKPGFFPFVSLAKDYVAGLWKQLVPFDVIITVDNKSINHRPDMWGHRGFAREISAFLNLSFIDIEHFIASLSVSRYQKTDVPVEFGSFHVRNMVPNHCSQFALMVVDLPNRPSDLFMALKLVHVGHKPISYIVDLTNYIMLDLSQPMHAYDLEKYNDTFLQVRMAYPDESIILLNQSTLRLTEHDIVIADSSCSHAIAGVMGGNNTSVDNMTKRILLEAAHFDPTFVRRSSARHHLRTESSARFEKTLDESQPVYSLARFVHAAFSDNSVLVSSKQCIVIGKKPKEVILDVDHEFLCARSGVQLSQDDIIKPLKSIGFTVKLLTNNDSITYRIIVPTFRSGKDITNKYDILEEVIRFYGFARIPHTLPRFSRKASSVKELYRARAIKKYLVAQGMTEQQNYVFFDQALIDRYAWPIQDALEIHNPVAEDRRTLLPSLVPVLLDNVVNNQNDRDSLSFFELGRIWSRDQYDLSENKRLAGIFFKKHVYPDFYRCKDVLSGLFASLGLSIRWCKRDNIAPFWLHGFQGACLYYGNDLIGHAGMLDPLTSAKMPVHVQSGAFVFDLDADFLCTVYPNTKRYKALSKYQSVTFDLSFFAPITCTTHQIECLLKNIDPLVDDVRLIDFFEKKEWLDKRSFTFRFVVRDYNKTLVREEIEYVRKKALACLASIDAELRS